MMKISGSVEISSPPKGELWRVVVIRSGMTADRKNYYPDDVLIKAARNFEDVPVYAFKMGEGLFSHIEDSPSKYAENLVGWLENAQVVKDGDDMVLEADLRVVDENWRKKLLNAWKEGIVGRIGLSINAQGKINGKREGADLVESIDEITSVDIVTYPAAGGKIVRLIQGGSEKMEKELREKIVELLKTLPLQGDINFDEVDDDQLVEMLTASIKALKEKGGNKEGEEPIAEGEEKKELADIIKDIINAINENKIKQATDWLKIALDKASKQGYGYPAPAKASESAPEPVMAELNELKEELSHLRLQSYLGERIKEVPPIIQPFVREAAKSAKTKEDVDRIIATAGGLLNSLQEGELDKEKVVVKREQKEIRDLRMDLVFDRSLRKEDKYRDLAPYTSFREIVEAYSRPSSMDFEKRLQEAVTSDFPVVLGSALAKAMLKEYRYLIDEKAFWRDLVTVVPVSSFKTQTRVQWGGFSPLAKVTEDNAYGAIAAPTQYSATYTPSKYGGIFTITREMIKNDDLNVLSRVPKNIARAAFIGLTQFIMDLILNYEGTPPTINGGTIYDGTALYTSAHGNLSANALSWGELKAAYQAMASQKDPGSTATLFINPKFLIVPLELEALALELVNSEKKPFPDTGESIETPNYLYNKLTVMDAKLVSPFLRGDANNWYLVADPATIECIEIGFIDGKEEPEILQRANPEAEGAWTKDREIEYKIRFEYGGAITDYRGFFAGIVS